MEHPVSDRMATRRRRYNASDHASFTLVGIQTVAWAATYGIGIDRCSEGSRSMAQNEVEAH
jgi:hypothetical protein